MPVARGVVSWSTIRRASPVVHAVPVHVAHGTAELPSTVSVAVTLSGAPAVAESRTSAASSVCGSACALL